MKVYDFYAPWCSPCKALEPTLTETLTRHNLPLRKINVEDERPVFNQFDVRTVPTLILVDEHDNEKARISGKITQKMLDSFLERA